MKRLIKAACLLAALLGSANASSWFGLSAETGSSTRYGIFAGSSLLSIPLAGTLGLEAAASLAANELPHEGRYAVGLTLRDVGFGPARGYGTLGLELFGSAQPYAELGLHGRLGFAGWRGSVRMNTASDFAFGFGLSLELR